MKLSKQQIREWATKGVRVVGDAADVLVQLGNDATPLGLVGVGARLVVSTLDKLERAPLKGWSRVPGVEPLEDFMLHLCVANHMVAPFGEKKDEARVMSGVVNGVRMAWVEYDRWIDGPFTLGEPSKAMAALRAFVWQALGCSIKFHKPALGPAQLLVDPITETLPSATAEQIWLRQEPYLAKGYMCSVLLVGEPGTGKSNIIRHVANRAGGHRLRIRARDLEHLRSLGQLVGFLRPDGVLIDDLDRAKDPGGILDELDELLTAASLLLVTANNVSKLDAAVVRRFDDVDVIDSLDDGVVDQLLEGAEEEVEARLRELPVRYIHQYKRAVAVVGPEAAALEVDDLVRRRALVRRISEAQGGETEKAEQ
jgi:hypothetical protein